MYGNVGWAGRYAALLLVLALSACSVVMSSDRSTAKGDVNAFQVGALRTAIEANFGQPSALEPIDGGKTRAVYRLDPNAHTEGAKAAAIAGHVVMDLLTLGLWEVVGTPLEIAARDQLVDYVLVYDPEQKVESVEIHK